MAGEDETKRRLDRRTSGADETASDGRWELYDRQEADWEPISEVSADAHIILHTSESPDKTLKVLLQKLYLRAPAPS